jgi:hypothetical protein
MAVFRFVIADMGLPFLKEDLSRDEVP